MYSLNKSNQHGFTLIEMMATIAILAIVVAAAAPTMQGMMQSNYTGAVSRSLISAFQYARSEAATKRTDIYVTAIDNDWAKGFTVWEDVNGDKIMNSNNSEVLQVYDELERLTITTSEPVYQVIFDDDGFLGTPAKSLELTIKVDDCKVEGRIVTINTTGRVDVETTACP